MIVTECPSKVKRVCRAEGCGAQILGTDINLHYKSRVNFKLLKELNIATKERAERMIINDLDNHTSFFFTNKFDLKRMPNWATHKPARKVIPNCFKQKIVQDKNQNSREENKNEESSELLVVLEEGNNDSDRHTDSEVVAEQIDFD